MAYKTLLIPNTIPPAKTIVSNVPFGLITNIIPNKISNIPSFQGIKTPMLHTEKGYIPDFCSRYFEEDFPYGLCIVKDFAVIAEVQTPNIDKILRWYEKMKNVEYFVEEKFIGKDLQDLPLPSVLGLYSKDKIYEFYLQ